jgi:hypothetical protein
VETNQLGFAVWLKFFQHEARFSRHCVGQQYRKSSDAAVICRGSLQAIPHAVGLFGGGAAGLFGNCDDGGKGNFGTQNRH